MTAAQLQRLDALPYGAAYSVIDTDAALSRLEAEVAAQESGWWIKYDLVLAAEWSDAWNAGEWVSHRTGQRDHAVASRRQMTSAQLQRLDALPYGAAYSVIDTTDAALSRLEAEVAAQESGWRIKYDLVLAAEWSDAWNAGRWVRHRSGKNDHAVAARRQMTSAQLQRLDALPYGREGMASTDPQ